MLFFSCLPEWCHPHSDSAYTKSWQQRSASTVAMATALPLPHSPQPKPLVSASHWQLLRPMREQTGDVIERTEMWVSEICWRTNLTSEAVTLAVISLKETGEGRRQMFYCCLLRLLPGLFFLYQYNQLTRGLSRWGACLGRVWHRAGNWLQSCSEALRRKKKIPG